MQDGFADIAQKDLLVAVAGLGVLWLVATLFYYMARWALVRGVRGVAASTDTHWDDELVEAGVFRRLAHLAPAFVVLQGLQVIPNLPDPFLDLVRRVTVAFMIVVGAAAFNGVLEAGERIYARQEKSRERPIKSYVQVFAIVVYLVAGLLALAALMNRSPWLFVSGIGAMTAVLLLIFRDTILSFVASIQIAGNDMIRVGDWIEMPNVGAEGDPTIEADRRRLTNLGTFRAWIWATLRSHPQIHQEGHTLLVRQLPSGPQGVPIEIYCFTADTAWVAYENIQSDLFDRVLAMVPEFGLRVYQEPAGSDLQAALASPRRVAEAGSA